VLQLQCDVVSVAVCCVALQCLAVFADCYESSVAVCCSVLQLQCVVVCCGVC